MTPRQLERQERDRRTERRVVLLTALQDLLGWSLTDAVAYVSGTRLHDLPAAHKIVDRRVRPLLRARPAVRAVQ